MTDSDPGRPLDVVVVGGCGHVGLPLALALVGRGLTVTSFDVAQPVVDLVTAGTMPFAEPQGPEMLAQGLASGRFRASTDPGVASEAEVIVVVIGTPVDEHQNPDPDAVRRAIAEIAEHLRDGQLLVLRSTVYPGVTRLVERFIGDLGRDIDVAFCPERIAEGKAFTELHDLPQIVSGCSPRAVQRATELFATLTDRIVELTTEEAELAKLFTNSWRYLKFAAANQLYMVANNYDLDYERIREAIRLDYPRAADLPGAGFAAGPCLYKDTAQLAAFSDNNFPLGNAAMLVNEGLPLYLVARLQERFDLSAMTVGILGMAFKGDSDDIRASLSYKLRRILRFKAHEVLCTDPHVRVDPLLEPLRTVVERADVLVIGAPHSVYATLATDPELVALVGDTPIVDVWNLLGRGVRV